MMYSYVLVASMFAGSVWALDCKPSVLSSPDDMFGQKFNCEDGSTAVYKRDTLGSSIEHEGEKYKASGLSDVGDEYHSIGGRSFGNGSVKLDRGGIFERLKIDED